MNSQRVGGFAFLVFLWPFWFEIFYSHKLSLSKLGDTFGFRHTSASAGAAAMLAIRGPKPQGNCLVPFYAVCCRTECDDLLGDLERKVGKASEDSGIGFQHVVRHDTGTKGDSKFLDSSSQ